MGAFLNKELKTKKRNAARGGGIESPAEALEDIIEDDAKYAALQEGFESLE